MFSLFKRKPRFQDLAFQDLAEMLTKEEQDPTYRKKYLRPNKLDYSIDSLKEIDDYLERIRNDHIEGRDLLKVVLRCGAYVGEVIRCHSTTKYHWLDYDEAARQSKVVKDMGKSLGSAAVLWAAPQSMCFPLAKVGKYIENGKEDSVLFFAQVIIKLDAEKTAQES
jgi:hypothetical protein